MIACLFATAGALIGGTVMYGWGRFDAATAVAVLDLVPAVSPTMIERVETQLTHGGLVTLVVGIPLFQLLLFTIPA